MQQKFSTQMQDFHWHLNFLPMNPPSSQDIRPPRWSYSLQTLSQATPPTLKLSHSTPPYSNLTQPQTTLILFSTTLHDTNKVLPFWINHPSKFPFPLVILTMCRKIPTYYRHFEILFHSPWLLNHSKRTFNAMCIKLLFFLSSLLSMAYYSSLRNRHYELVSAKGLFS